MVNSTSIYDQIMKTDRQWFTEHPGKDVYVREFIPREFDPLDDPRPGVGVKLLVAVRVVGRDKKGDAIVRMRTLLFCQSLH